MNPCKHGHDKNVVGSLGDGRCKECRRIYDLGHRESRKSTAFVNPICVNGHDKRVVGSRWGGACAECQRAHNRRYLRKKTRERAKHNPYCVIEARYLPKLRETRRDLGLSVQELAKLTGVSASALYKIETCEHRARPYALRRILPVVAEKLRERKWEEVA
jgi:DNA-binding XRE family transcriptional regulator